MPSRDGLLFDQVERGPTRPADSHPAPRAEQDRALTRFVARRDGTGRVADPLAPGAGVEGSVDPQLGQRQQVVCRSDTRAAVDAHCADPVALHRGPVLGEVAPEGPVRGEPGGRRAVDRARHVTGDGVDRLGLTGVALGRPGIEQHSVTGQARGPVGIERGQLSGGHLDVAVPARPGSRSRRGARRPATRHTRRRARARRRCRASAAPTTHAQRHTTPCRRRRRRGCSA